MKVRCDDKHINQSTFLFNLMYLKHINQTMLQFHVFRLKENCLPLRC